VLKAVASDWLAEHRRVWALKPVLRLVYGRWFRLLREACAPGSPIVELGCGPGFFGELHPEVLATDVRANPYADQLIDAAALPYAAGRLANLVMLDVFHHLPEPAELLREAARTLVPGGRLVMIEPWVGLAGRLFYRYVHRELCDLSVDPADPWGGGGKDPMEGNVTLPYLYFRAGGYLDRLGLPLRVVRREPFAAVPWLLSGGFQPFGLLPAALAGVAESLDRAVSLLPSLTATRCLIVVEKTG
jgi:SAM-dependent methyltransferase